jgi:hypothetical protein
MNFSMAASVLDVLYFPLFSSDFDRLLILFVLFIYGFIGQIIISLEKMLATESLNFSN